MPPPSYCTRDRLPSSCDAAGPGAAVRGLGGAAARCARRTATTWGKANLQGAEKKERWIVNTSRPSQRPAAVLDSVVWNSTCARQVVDSGTDCRHWLSACIAAQQQRKGVCGPTQCLRPCGARFHWVKDVADAYHSGISSPARSICRNLVPLSFCTCMLNSSRRSPTEEEPSTLASQIQDGIGDM